MKCSECRERPAKPGGKTCGTVCSRARQVRLERRHAKRMRRLRPAKKPSHDWALGPDLRECSACGKPFAVDRDSFRKRCSEHTTVKFSPEKWVERQMRDLKKLGAV